MCADVCVRMRPAAFARARQINLDVSCLGGGGGNCDRVRVNISQAKAAQVLEKSGDFKHLAAQEMDEIKRLHKSFTGKDKQVQLVFRVERDWHRKGCLESKARKLA